MDVQNNDKSSKLLAEANIPMPYSKLDDKVKNEEVKLTPIFNLAEMLDQADIENNTKPLKHPPEGNSAVNYGVFDKQGMRLAPFTYSPAITPTQKEDQIYGRSIRHPDRHPLEGNPAIDFGVLETKDMMRWKLPSYAEGIIFSSNLDQMNFQNNRNLDNDPYEGSPALNFGGEQFQNEDPKSAPLDSLPEIASYLKRDNNSEPRMNPFSQQDIGSYEDITPQQRPGNLSGRMRPFDVSYLAGPPKEIPVSVLEISVAVEQENPLEEKTIHLFHEHFSCSEHDHAHKPNEKATKYRDGDLWEADTYRYEFNFSIFAKALTISLFDIFGLKILILFYWLVSSSKFINNFYRFGYINTCINYVGWINMVFMIYSIYQKSWIYTDASSLGYMVGLLFLSIIGASEMSFMNKKIPDLLETVKLSGESCKKAGGLRAVSIQEELKRTILRLNFDASSFFMSFIEHDQETAKQFPRSVPKEQLDPDLSDIQWLAKAGQQFEFVSIDPPKIKGISDKEDRLIWQKKIGKSNLIANAMKFERAVFYLKFLTRPCRFDDQKAYGYRYARDILEAFEEDVKYPYAIILNVMGVIGTVVVSFVKFDDSDLDPLENAIVGYVRKGALLLLNGLVTLVILYLISEGTHMIWTRLYFVKGLTELISEERPPEDTVFRRLNPMINIFDFESLRTWGSLRMIFMNLNQKRLDSISLAISIIVAIQLMTITVLGFFYFTSEWHEQKAFFLQYIIFFGTPTIIYMIFVLLFISIGAQVNNQYQEHIYRLKTLKITIYKLFALYSTFTGPGRIQPTTYLFAKGLRYLEKLDEIKDLRYRSVFRETRNLQEILDQKLAKINEAYDTIIAELEVEEKYRPLQLLGIPMTDSFAGTVFGTILTVIMIPVGKYLADITGWG